MLCILEKYLFGIWLCKYEFDYRENGEGCFFGFKKEIYLVILINEEFILKLYEVEREIGMLFV